MCVVCACVCVTVTHIYRVVGVKFVREDYCVSLRVCVALPKLCVCACVCVLFFCMCVCFFEKCISGGGPLPSSGDLGYVAEMSTSRATVGALPTRAAVQL